MSIVSEIPHSMEMVVPQQRISSRAPLWYAIFFVIFQLGALLVLLCIMQRPWFLTHNGYPGIYQAGYGMRLVNANCDIVLYGDSSALTGLDPQLIAAKTGLKTCNIAEARGVEDVVGFRYPLDTYLARNKRPRFVLIMLGPAAFDPAKKPFTSFSTEGMIYALEYDHGRKMLQGFARRPGWVTNFMFWAAESTLENEWKQLSPWARTADLDTRKQRADRDGLWAIPLPPEVHCDFTLPVYTPVAADIAAARRRYAVNGTQVIINVSPIANCNPHEDMYRKQLDGLHDNTLVTLPMSAFNASDIHFSPSGSAYVSTEAAEQILELMRRDDAEKPKPSPSTVQGPIRQ